jgi:hypothetical protein
MREAGNSIDDIVSTLAVSWDGVRMVARKFETEEILSARSSRFLKEIRKVDDLNKKWKVSYLAQAIRPLVMTQNAITHHFEWGKTPEISLLKLMELAISDRHHPKPGFLLTPLLEVRCVGVEGFWSLVGRLTKADLGEACNREWRRRLPRLHGCSRIAGRETYWSKPCEMPTWVRELVEAA